MHTYFSLRYGTLSPEQLVIAAQERGVRSMALTDRNGTSALYSFGKHCLAAGIQPVAGVDIQEGDERRYILLAQNALGLAEINRFRTRQAETQTPFPEKAPPLRHVWVIYPWQKQACCSEANEWIGVRATERSFLYQATRPERLVALQPVIYLDTHGLMLHRILRAIDHNTLLDHLPPIDDAAYFPTPQELENEFCEWPELLQRSQTLLDTCTWDMDWNTPVTKNKRVFLETPEQDHAHLKALTWEGAAQRYGEVPPIDRINKELDMIIDLGFASYFLITWDFVFFAKKKGFFHVGRGSGANSIVAYCLGITDVDPMELDLYFERFINPFRQNPPDFDIDFSWDQRDVILQYMFDRHGTGHVCLLATYTTFQEQSAYREIAKVLGLPKAEIDAWLEHRQAVDTPTAFILHYGKQLTDFPNYLGIHAGGVLVSEKPLAYYTASLPMPKGFPICEFDMYVAEEMGFAKFDILSQRGLGHIKEAVYWIKRNQGVEVDIHAVERFKTDASIREQLRQHETMGCFYIESPAMRQLIWKLRCDNYLTLVAASSIIRPGVASSGMMQAYIEYHHRPDQVRYLHPLMQTLLQETYGIMVYQEDVIKVAHHFAGLTLAEADLLRRGMSGKFRSRAEFEKIADRFFEECRRRGYDEHVTQEVWRQIASFSGYSFSKAHSASFAVESYQSLYLKAYYPLEFLVAVINNFGGFYQTEFYLREARRWGATLELPEVNQSERLTSITQETIWMGWVHIKGLERKSIDLLQQARKEGPFRSFDDFCRRVPLGLEQLIILIRIGAFRFLHRSKKALLWLAHTYAQKQLASARDVFEESLPAKNFLFPKLTHSPVEDMYDELELLGFTLFDPFLMLTHRPTHGLVARELPAVIGQEVDMLGYLITVKSTRTQGGERMYFGYFLDEEGNYFDTVHFPASLRRSKFTGKGVYVLTGVVSETYGHPALTIRTMQRIPFLPDPRYPK